MQFYIPIEVRFRDLDGLNHVNNVVYLSYVEQARIHYFDHVMGERFDWNRWGVLLARTEINYLKPLHLKDDCKVGIECVNIGRKSLEFQFKIFRSINGVDEEIASGLNILVCFDHVEKQSIEVPQEWKNAIEKYEDNL